MIDARGRRLGPHHGVRERLTASCRSSAHRPSAIATGRGQPGDAEMGIWLSRGPGAHRERVPRLLPRRARAGGRAAADHFPTARPVAFTLLRERQFAAAWRLYRTLLPWNVRLGKWKFLLGFPVWAAWRQTVGRTATPGLDDRAMLSGVLRSSSSSSSPVASPSRSASGRGC